MGDLGFMSPSACGGLNPHFPLETILHAGALLLLRSLVVLLCFVCASGLPTSLNLRSFNQAQKLHLFFILIVQFF